jgi:uncharacterized hydrophobic protein (TIGR00271 family)
MHPMNPQQTDGNGQQVTDAGEPRDNQPPQQPGSLVLMGRLVDELRMRLAHLLRVNEERKSDIYIQLAQSAELRELNYWLQVIFACGIATLGLVLNSPAVVIGAMLISPMMEPILANGLSLVLGDFYLGLKSLVSILLSALTAICFSALLVALLPFKTITGEIAARIQPTALDLTVALFCGLAGAVGTCLSQTRAGTAAPGVAIAVALMPPLCVVGFGVGVGLDLRIIKGGGLLFLANLVAIIFSSMLVFFIVRMDTDAVRQQAARWEVRKEELEQRFSQFVRWLPLSQKAKSVGTPRARVTVILLFLVVIFIPLQSALNRVTREVAIRQGVNSRVSMFAQRGRSTIDSKETVIGDDKVIVFLRVSTSRFFTQADRDEFERGASTALGVPVEVELTQNLASIGDGDTITRLLASRAQSAAPAPATLAELAESVRQRLQGISSGLPFPPEHAILEMRGVTSDRIDRLGIEVVHMGENDLAPETRTVISQIIRREAGVAEMDVSFTRIVATMPEVVFASGSDALNDVATNTTDHAGEILTRYPSLSVNITGYADKRESRRNANLAKKRAMAVQSRLSDNWRIDPKRIAVKTAEEPRRVVMMKLIRG